MVDAQLEYIREKLKEAERYQPLKEIYDYYHEQPDNIWYRKDVANLARDYAVNHPREGQPVLDWSPLTQKAWLKEGLLREKEIRNWIIKMRKRNERR